MNIREVGSLAAHSLVASILVSIVSSCGVTAAAFAFHSDSWVKWMTTSIFVPVAVVGMVASLVSMGTLIVVGLIGARRWWLTRPA